MPTSSHDAGRDGYGEVPAISQWLTYLDAPSIALIGNASYVSSRALPSGDSVAYLVSFLAAFEHEATHVTQVYDFNSTAVPFFDRITGRIANIDAACVHVPPAPGVPCGWAFANNGAPVRQTHPYWNRYQEIDGVVGFSSADVNLDPDDDLVPSMGGWDAHSDPAANDLEIPAYDAETSWVGAEPVWDWGSLGANRDHTGSCPP